MLLENGAKNIKFNYHLWDIGKELNLEKLPQKQF